MKSLTTEEKITNKTTLKQFTGTIAMPADVDDYTDVSVVE